MWTYYRSGYLNVVNVYTYIWFILIHSKHFTLHICWWLDSDKKYADVHTCLHFPGRCCQVSSKAGSSRLHKPHSISHTRTQNQPGLSRGRKLKLGCLESLNRSKEDTDCREWSYRSHPVEKNPANQWIYSDDIPIFSGFHTCQVVKDFFQQQ